MNLDAKDIKFVLVAKKSESLLALGNSPSECLTSLSLLSLVSLSLSFLSL